MTDLLMPKGPMLGPNSVEVVCLADTGESYTLTVFPDGHNVELAAKGLAQWFYFLPERVFLARKQDAPTDYDFCLMMFKGLMDSEDTIAVSTANETDGEVGIGGGICTFATTFAIPPEVLAGVIEQLQAGTFTPGAKTSSDVLSKYYTRPAGAPVPMLGIVPCKNDVTIEVPQFTGVGDAKNPIVISAQGAGKGSIDASSISAFLVTMNMLAAGIVGGSLKAGLSPFTVTYNLSEFFYLEACVVDVTGDYDKIFKQFSTAADVNLGFTELSFQAAYQSCITSGSISTVVSINGVQLPPDSDMKTMIDTQVKDLQKMIMDQVKAEIFDFKPQPDSAATASASKGWLGSLFGGGGSVSMKVGYQEHKTHLTAHFELDSTVAVADTKSGDLSDLLPAIKANLDKYYTVIDIGEAFEKLQVAATTNVSWSETLPDGTDLSDPISSIQVEVGYPDFDNPLGADSKPNPQYRATGSHYQPGSGTLSAGNGLAVWTAANARDIVNIDFLKLANPAGDWNVDQVKLRETIVFRGEDPRVDLANGGTVYVTESITKKHAPVITADKAGYVFVRFMLDRQLPKDNIIVTLTVTIGARTDTLLITRSNQKNAVWELFSDKYLAETHFTYTVAVEVVGPDFTDDPVSYGGDTTFTVPLDAGRIKLLTPCLVKMPQASPADNAIINGYIAKYPLYVA